MKNCCLLRYISPKLRIHLLILRIEPDELPLLHPATKSDAKNPGKGLSSHGVAPTVLSVLRRFTTVFGMGTGGSTARYHQGNRALLVYSFDRVRCYSTSLFPQRQARKNPEGAHHVSAPRFRAGVVITIVGYTQPGSGY